MCQSEFAQVAKAAVKYLCHSMAIGERAVHTSGRAYQSHCERRVLLAELVVCSGTPHPFCRLHWEVLTWLRHLGAGKVPTVGANLITELLVGPLVFHWKFQSQEWHLAWKAPQNCGCWLACSLISTAGSKNVCTVRLTTHNDVCESIGIGIKHRTAGAGRQTWPGSAS